MPKQDLSLSSNKKVEDPFKQLPEESIEIYTSGDVFLFPFSDGTKRAYLYFKNKDGRITYQSFVVTKNIENLDQLRACEDYGKAYAALKKSL